MTPLLFSFSTLPYQEVRDFLLETNNEFPTPLSESVDINEYAAKLSKLSVFSLCRIPDGEIIGMISCYINRPPVGYISNACVKSSYQGKGIFTSLFSLLKEKASDQAISSLRLEVEESNQKALDIYLHLGFTVLERRECTHKLLLGLNI